MVLFLLTLIFVVVHKAKEVSFSKQGLLLIVTSLLVMIINPSASYSTFFSVLLMLLVSLLFTSLVSFDDFSDVFIKMLRVVILFSLLSFLVIRFNIPSPLPALKSIADFYYRNFLVFCVSERFIEEGINRNSGIWWEPGAFQLFINVAFAFGIITGKFKKWDYWLFAFGIISTFSTTGLVAFFILSMLYFKREVRKMSFSKIALVLILGLAGISLILIFAGDIIFSKLSEDSNSFASTLSRVYDWSIDWDIFKLHPILGSGVGNTDFREAYALKLIGPLQYFSPAKPTGADGLLLLLSQVGLLGGFLLIPGLLFPAFVKNCMTLIERCCYCIAMLLIFNTQNFCYTLIFYVLVLYSISYKRKEQV